MYNQFDLYPAYGIPVGMVVEVFNGGKNGKVISLKNIVDMPWSTPEAISIKTDATDYNDGITNTMKIQSFPNWEVNYPAVKACASYGENWYLPSIGDMAWFFTNVNTWNNNFLTRINNNLDYHRKNNSGLDIQLIISTQSYFSSTESSTDHTKAAKLYPANGDIIYEPKDWNYYIRPFFDF